MEHSDWQAQHVYQVQHQAGQMLSHTQSCLNWLEQELRWCCAVLPKQHQPCPLPVAANLQYGYLHCWGQLLPSPGKLPLVCLYHCVIPLLTFKLYTQELCADIWVSHRFLFLFKQPLEFWIVILYFSHPFIGFPFSVQVSVNNALVGEQIGGWYSVLKAICWKGYITLIMKY